MFLREDQHQSLLDDRKAVDQASSLPVALLLFLSYRTDTSAWASLSRETHTNLGRGEELERKVIAKFIGREVGSEEDLTSL